ncbi:hypothetical protein ACQEU3_46930 [Spirillospora sp. CA-253888]
MTTAFAVYDIRDPSWRSRYDHIPAPQQAAFIAWGDHHGIDLNNTARLEIHLTDRLIARVTYRERHPEGHLVIDDQTNEIKRLPPVDVPITSKPPLPPHMPAPA